MNCLECGKMINPLKHDYFPTDDLQWGWHNLCWHEMRTREIQSKHE